MALQIQVTEMTKYLTTALALTIAMLPFAANSSQPDVKLTDLGTPAQNVAVQPGFGFFLDPDVAPQFRIKLPSSINELDIDRDPFAAADLA